nr:polynucleotide kinase-phosphatase [Leptospira venezuelensis]
MDINVPELSVVVLIGTSGSGKSSFAKKHFLKTEILSSDECRGIVSNDENDQSATEDAFELLHYILGKRLKKGLLTVVDATNVQKESRRPIIEISRAYHCLPVAIVLDIPENICIERNKHRIDRSFGPHVIRNQRSQLRRSIRNLRDEGFRKIYVLKSPEEVDSVLSIIREKLYNNKKEESGPFDIIGDIHGCYEETKELLEKLGYIIHEVEDDGLNFGFEILPPQNRKVVFVGDLVDRGPDSPSVLRLVMSMVNSGAAFCVAGNHDWKLQKYLNGKKVTLKHGLEKTVEQLEKVPDGFVKSIQTFLDNLISHYVFDRGKLVVAHAGLKEEMQGRGSGAVRSFCMYGETTGEIDEFGLPVRYPWAREYRGHAKVVYGHTPVKYAEWLNNTINIDTGCVFGGKLTALRYPEEEIVQVDAKKTYYESAKPLNFDQKGGFSSQQEEDDLLDIGDVIGKRIVQTSLKNNITIREENSISTLEVMSRFAVNPKWLIYLPPTMSPCSTSELSGFLEHPQQAFEYYQKRGITKIVCEEKHMGSRAIITICKNEEIAKLRFGIEEEGFGICYTRTGRNFFNDPSLEKEFLDHLNRALTVSGFWEKFQTDWVCMDSELMPWSLKAQALIRDQYAAVYSAAFASFSDAIHLLKQAANLGSEEASKLIGDFENKQTSVSKYESAYSGYCWEVKSIADLKLAPFHILATEGKTYTDKSHAWHMENISEICRFDSNLLRATEYRSVNLESEKETEDAISWWLNLVSKGGEGMVVKPYDFLAFGKEGLLQPAIKCRGPEYLRIIYGPEYDRPENLERLRKRGLARKRSLALREFALGIEALERFVKKEPLRRIHESVFGVLALESEDVDPRL